MNINLIVHSYPSNAPLTIILLLNLIHETNSSQFSNILKQAPYSISHNLNACKKKKKSNQTLQNDICKKYLIVLSKLPLTTNRSLYWRQVIP